MPVYAIGGIKPENIIDVHRLGVRGVALISAIISADRSERGCNHAWRNCCGGECLGEAATKSCDLSTTQSDLGLWASLSLPGLPLLKPSLYDRRSGFVLFLLIGLIGLFLGEFVLIYFQLDEYLETISEFRILFDFIAAYIGSFIVAAIIHFVRPT